MKIQRSTSNNALFKRASAYLTRQLATSNNKNILDQIEISLVIFEGYLIDTESGRYQHLSTLEAEDIAKAASTLIFNKAECKNILLLMPPTNFIGMVFDVAIKDEKMLQSALALQSHSFLPAFDSDLLLAVNTADSKGIALWFSSKQSNDLFAEFKKQGFFLSAIMPRNLALMGQGKDEDIVVIDEDEHNCAHTHVMKGSIKSLQSVNKADLLDSNFATQWQSETSNIKSDVVKEFKQLDDWRNIRKKISGLSCYCFYPVDAQNEVKANESRKRVKYSIGLAVALMLLVWLPFINAWLKIQKLENEISEQQELAVEARSLRSSIYAMEDEWGPIIDYPRAEVIDVLLTLNNIDEIRNALTGFTLEKGIIDLTGSADDPAYLLEELAEYEEFIDITQSRSISGNNNGSGDNRFGIRMQQRDVDFVGYEEKYPIIKE